jgi:hypothetical protein
MLVAADDPGLVREAIAYMRFIAQIRRAIEGGGREKWRALRQLYAEKDEHIRARWPSMCGPYPVDWKFTPIEAAAWQQIRCLGLPLYPQYPVGRYFVDFGDPVRRIAIECDGKAYHDAERDAARDAQIRALGWSVHRFTGRQCYLPLDHPESLDAWLESLCRTYYRVRD